jgi:hypothetical protein
MKTVWRFSPGLKGNPQTSIVDFHVCYTIFNILITIPFGTFHFYSGAHFAKYGDGAGQHITVHLLLASYFLAFLHSSLRKILQFLFYQWFHSPKIAFKTQASFH